MRKRKNRNTIVSSRRNARRIDEENPVEVAARNGWEIDPRWREEPKWLYLLAWQKEGLIKIGLTKPQYRNRMNSIMVRARSICIKEGLPFPDHICSTGGTSTQEQYLRQFLMDFKLHGRRDWFEWDRESNLLIQNMAFFDEHVLEGL